MAVPGDAGGPLSPPFSTQNSLFNFASSSIADNLTDPVLWLYRTIEQSPSRQLHFPISIPKEQRRLVNREFGGLPGLISSRPDLFVWNGSSCVELARREPAEKLARALFLASNRHGPRWISARTLVKKLSEDNQRLAATYASLELLFQAHTDQFETQYRGNFLYVRLLSPSAGCITRSSSSPEVLSRTNSFDSLPPRRELPQRRPLSSSSSFSSTVIPIPPHSPPSPPLLSSSPLQNSSSMHALVDQHPGGTAMSTSFDEFSKLTPLLHTSSSFPSYSSSSSSSFLSSSSSSPVFPSLTISSSLSALPSAASMTALHSGLSAFTTTSPTTTTTTTTTPPMKSKTQTTISEPPSNLKELIDLLLETLQEDPDEWVDATKLGAAIHARGGLQTFGFNEGTRLKEVLQQHLSELFELKICRTAFFVRQRSADRKEEPLSRSPSSGCGQLRGRSSHLSEDQDALKAMISQILMKQSHRNAAANGWVDTALVGTIISRQGGLKKFGYRSLSSFLRECPDLFEIQNSDCTRYLRLKQSELEQLHFHADERSSSLAPSQNISPVRRMEHRAAAFPHDQRPSQLQVQPTLSSQKHQPPHHQQQQPLQFSKQLYHYDPTSVSGPLGQSSDAWPISFDFMHTADHYATSPLSKSPSEESFEFLTEVTAVSAANSVLFDSD